MGTDRTPHRGSAERRQRSGAADLTLVRATYRRPVSGFSLLEVIVAIVIVGILLSLALPQLSKFRANSRRLQSQTNLKQLQLVTMLYAGDYRDLFPATYEGAWYRVGYGMRISFPYWQVYSTWPGPVYGYLPLDRNLEIYRSPGSTREFLPGGFQEPSYHYSTSFVGPSALWSGRFVGGSASESQVPQRVGSVRFPSAKAVLWDEEPGFDHKPIRRVQGSVAQPTPMAFADGAVSQRSPLQASDAVPNPVGNTVSNLRLHNTRNGIGGLDYAASD